MDALEAKVRMMELAAQVAARTHDNSGDGVVKLATCLYNGLMMMDQADKPATPGTLKLPKK